MGCFSCAERGRQIVAGARAAAAGNMTAAAEAAKAFGKTIRTDANALKGKIASARTSLMKR